MSTLIDVEFERQIGHTVLCWIGATLAGRWESPRGGLDYLQVREGTTEALVRDFVAWSSGFSKEKYPEAYARMFALAQELFDTGFFASLGFTKREVA